jgi:DnaK suppressor protein
VTPRAKEEARAELRRRKAAILQATQRADAEVDALRTADRGQELEEVAQTEQGLADLERLGDAERLELVRIDAALERLDKGTYGTCDDCGRPIEARRLAALPWAVLCSECAAALERRSATR